MSTDAAKDLRLELLLARLLYHGTWLASAVIGVGLTLVVFERPAGAAALAASSGMRIVTAGIGCFILLPVLRVIAMLIVFVRARDHHFIAITAIVLTIILMGFAIGMYLPAASLS
jgi:Protein of unknown function (DUF1634)